MPEILGCQNLCDFGNLKIPKVLGFPALLRLQDPGNSRFHKILRIPIFQDPRRTSTFPKIPRFVRFRNILDSRCLGIPKIPRARCIEQRGCIEQRALHRTMRAGSNNMVHWTTRCIEQRALHRTTRAASNNARCIEPRALHRRTRAAKNARCIEQRAIHRTMRGLCILLRCPMYARWQMHAQDC